MPNGFNISQFNASIERNGVLKTNKFLVRIPMPPILQGKYDGSARFLELWCHATNIPGVQLVTSEVRRYGYGNFEKKPYVNINQDVNFSFISDASGAIWTLFQQWMKSIINYDLRGGIQSATGGTVLPYEVAYKDDYAVDVTIMVFDDAGRPSLTIVLRDSYPIFVGDMQLAWEDQNSFARVPVVFTMQDWYNETVQTGVVPSLPVPNPGQNGPISSPPIVTTKPTLTDVPRRVLDVKNVRIQRS